MYSRALTYASPDSSQTVSSGSWKNDHGVVSKSLIGAPSLPFHNYVPSFRFNTISHFITQHPWRRVITTLIRHSVSWLAPTFCVISSCKQEFCSWTNHFFDFRLYYLYTSKIGSALDIISQSHCNVTEHNWYIICMYLYIVDTVFGERKASHRSCLFVWHVLWALDVNLLHFLAFALAGAK